MFRNVGRPGALLIGALAFLFFGLCSPASHGDEAIKPQIRSLTVAIDIGHSRASPGATSAAGVPEYRFNKIFADSLHQELSRKGHVRSFLIGGNRDLIPLDMRAAGANRMKADLFISIHHDSVQPQFLTAWSHKGRARLYSDRYRGFSIFYSEKNKNTRKSLAFARDLGTELLKEGLSPTMHHAERIRGENRQLVDEERGIYRYDDLVVLKKTTAPAVLLECGIIVNRQEEASLSDPNYRMKIIGAIQRAIDAYGSRRE